MEAHYKWMDAKLACRKAALRHIDFARPWTQDLLYSDIWSEGLFNAGEVKKLKAHCRLVNSTVSTSLGFKSRQQSSRSQKRKASPDPSTPAQGSSSSQPSAKKSRPQSKSSKGSTSTPRSDNSSSAKGNKSGWKKKPFHGEKPEGGSSDKRQSPEVDTNKNIQWSTQGRGPPHSFLTSLAGQQVGLQHCHFRTWLAMAATVSQGPLPGPMTDTSSR